jgi:hypothetical protein
MCGWSLIGLRAMKIHGRAKLRGRARLRPSRGRREPTSARTEPRPTRSLGLGGSEIVGEQSQVPVVARQLSPELGEPLMLQLPDSFGS